MKTLVVTCVLLGALLIPVLTSTIQTTSTSQRLSDSTVTQASQNTSATKTTNITPSTSLSQKTTTQTSEGECALLNTSCDACVKNSKCLYCYSDNTCKLYPSGRALPSSDDCALDEARWGVCWLNFQAMIISVSVIGGVIVFTITFCCIYCCCCRSSGNKKQELENKKHESRKMERQGMQTERRAERKSRMDDIRKKYGLMKDDPPYQHFES